MIRSKLRNNFLKDRTENNKEAYCKQRNTYVNNLRKTKKQYYWNLEVSKVAGNKKFWKTVKNLFSDKSNNYSCWKWYGNFWRSENSRYFHWIFWYYSTKIKLNNTKARHSCYKWYWGLGPEAVHKYQEHASILAIKENYNYVIYKMNQKV